MDDKKEIQVVNNSNSIVKSDPNWKSKIELVKRMCAKNCSNDEFELFMYTAEKYGLDPLNKEIWAIKYGSNPAMIMSSRDGFLSIAHRSGQFDGMETTYTKCENGEDDSATCIVYRKDMKYPIKSTVYLNEFNKSANPLWNSKPKVMLCKVSESFALRRAFSVHSIYTTEEIDQVKTDEIKTSFEVVANDEKEKPIKIGKPVEIETISEKPDNSRFV